MAARAHAPNTRLKPYPATSPEARALNVLGDKWTLLIIRELRDGPVRFVGLQKAVAGISTEQLRSRLNAMVADKVVTRTRYREVPPRVMYELTARGRDALRICDELRNWSRIWQDERGN